MLVYVVGLLICASIGFLLGCFWAGAHADRHSRRIAESGTVEPSRMSGTI